MDTRKKTALLFKVIIEPARIVTDITTPALNQGVVGNAMSLALASVQQIKATLLGVGVTMTTMESITPMIVSQNQEKNGNSVMAKRPCRKRLGAFFIIINNSTLLTIIKNGMSHIQAGFIPPDISVFAFMLPRTSVRGRKSLPSSWALAQFLTTATIAIFCCRGN